MDRPQFTYLQRDLLFIPQVGRDGIELLHSSDEVDELLSLDRMRASLEM